MAEVEGLELIGEDIGTEGESLFEPEEETKTSEESTTEEEPTEDPETKSFFSGLSAGEIVSIGIFATSLIAFIPQLKKVLVNVTGLSSQDVDNISNNLQQISGSISSNGKITSKIQPQQLKLYSETLQTLKNLSINNQLPTQVNQSLNQNNKLNNQINTMNKVVGNVSQTQQQQRSTSGSAEKMRRRRMRGGAPPNTIKNQLSIAFIGTDVFTITVTQITIFLIIMLILWYSGIHIIYTALISYVVTGLISFLLLRFGIFGGPVPGRAAT